MSGDAFADDLGEYTPIVPVVLAAAGVAQANTAVSLIEEHGPEIVKLAPGFGAANGVVASPAFANADAERRRIQRATADFLLALSSEVGLVICLNDLQWAPRGSIDVLTTLLDRLPAFPAARLAIIGSYRSDGLAGAPLEGVLRSSNAARPHRHVALAPFDAGATETVVVSMLGSNVAPDLVRYLHATSGGFPFLLEQALRNLAAAGELAVRDGAVGLMARLEVPLGPVSSDAAVLEGLARLDQKSRALLDVLAACGRPVAPEIVARAAETTPEQVVTRLRFLEEQQLVVLLAGHDSKYGLANDSIREAVSASWDPGVESGSARPPRRGVYRDASSG